MNTIIEFEDNGQDFLRWLVAPCGRVIDCTPSQGWMWIGLKVVATQTRIPDGKRVVIIQRKDEAETCLKHAIKSQWETKIEAFKELGAVA